MGERTTIPWCHHTFNTHWGCTKVSPGCTNCYAAELDAWLFQGRHWGRGKPRRVFGEAHWHQPRRWNKAAELAGVRRRVFCLSMGDIADVDAPASELAKLWPLIEQTEWLDWLLLSKRPERYVEILPKAWRDTPRHNVWTGATVENRETAETRCAALLDTPSALRFLSMEPLIEAVDLTRVQLFKSPPWPTPIGGAPWRNVLTGNGMGPSPMTGVLIESSLDHHIDWVIVGGESGKKARPFHLNWAHDLVAQCQAAGVPVFFKQAGDAPVLAMPEETSATMFEPGSCSTRLVQIKPKHAKGEDLAEWPEELRVRQFPEVRR